MAITAEVVRPAMLYGSNDHKTGDKAHESEHKLEGLKTKKLRPADVVWTYAYGGTIDSSVKRCWKAGTVGD